MKSLLPFFLVLLAYSTQAQNCPDSCKVDIPSLIHADSEEFQGSLLLVTSECNFLKYRIQVFNRWGVELFTSDDPRVHFDASAKKMKDGAYFYKL